MNTLRRKDLILPELSYTIVGALFEVFDQLGSGHRERYYYLAVYKALEKRGLKVKTQVSIPLEFDGLKIGKYFLDFLIEDKVVLELKINKRFYKKDFEQIKDYLKVSGCQLGILARLSEGGVTFLRVLPPK